MSPYLFILVLDKILKGVIKEVPWWMLFADDMVVIAIANSAEEANRMLESEEGVGSKGVEGE